MIGPTYSCGRCTVAVMIGSSIASYLPWSGTFAGLSSSMTSPPFMLHAVAHARRRRDEVQVELALEPLLDDLHVEQAEEAGAEAEAERRRRLGLVRDARVVEHELAERVLEILVVGGVDGEQTRRTPSA